jgi:Plasmid pRiA4b ORF-3-like protein
MPNILTLEIKVLHHHTDAKPWSVKVAAAEDTSLADLHLAIQEFVDFQNDHLYEFFIGRHEGHRKIIFRAADLFDEDHFLSDEQNGGDDTTPLSQIFPTPKSHKLFYLFDFGDDWCFSIACKSIKPQTEPTITKIKLI